MVQLSLHWKSLELWQSLVETALSTRTEQAHGSFRSGKTQVLSLGQVCPHMARTGQVNSRTGPYYRRLLSHLQRCSSVTSPRAVQALTDLQLTENLKQGSSLPTEWLSHYPTQQWHQVFLFTVHKTQTLLCNFYECRLVLLAL